MLPGVVAGWASEQEAIDYLAHLDGKKGASD